MIIGSQGHSSCWVRWGSIKVCFDIEIGLQLPFLGGLSLHLNHLIA